MGLERTFKRSDLEVTDLVSVVAQSDIVFLAVQTPHQPEFEGTTKLGPDRADFDYKYLKDAIQSVAIAAQSLQKPTFLAVISTCLPGTFRTQIVPLLNQYIDYVYTPQFIAMGTVIKDYLNPEFALIGVDSDAAAMKLGAFYGSLFNVPHVITDITTAEGIKVSYNTWITAKTVIANVWGELCEKLNMNFNDMFKAWGLSTDRLISTKYMEAGMGDGGHCHPRDNIALSWLACKTNSWDFFTDLMTAREMHEKFHADYIADLVDIYNLPVYILGKSFKPESNIETGSPALLLANILDTIYPKLDYAHHEDMVPIAQGIYFIATKNDRYRKYDFLFWIYRGRSLPGTFLKDEDVQGHLVGKKMTKFLAIVVAYKNPKLTLDAAISAHRQGDTRVVVWDNFSSEGVQQELVHKLPSRNST